MRVWVAAVIALGVAGAGVGLWRIYEARDGAPIPQPSEWRPAKQVTLAATGGGTKTVHLQPDEKAVRDASMARIVAFDQRWNDALRLASTTPQMQLAGPIRDLQSLARESAAVELSPCFDQGRLYWTGGLDAEARAMMAFMASQWRDKGVAEQDARAHLSNWAKVVDACR